MESRVVIPVLPSSAPVVESLQVFIWVKGMVSRQLEFPS